MKIFALFICQNIYLKKININNIDDNCNFNTQFSLHLLLIFITCL